MHAYTKSISMIWLINTPILGAGLILGSYLVPLHSITQDVIPANSITDAQLFFSAFVMRIQCSSSAHIR